MKLFIRLVLLSLCTVVFVWGRDIPAYVTAWPKQVTVEKPDPVLGDKLVWEHWIYSERFAKRFDGFSIEQADPELQNSPIQAIVLRFYKDNIWKEIHPSYASQYMCNIDIYFNDSIKVPLSMSNKSKKIIGWRIYPDGVLTSYEKLNPKSEIDKNMMLKATSVNVNVETNPVIFADKPLDGRYATFGVRDYIPHFLNGISILSLQAGIEGAVVGPKSSTGIFWISLFGKLPYKNENALNSPRALAGMYTDINTSFQPGIYPENNGYIRLPQSFQHVVLPKVTLIKSINQCITYVYGYEKRKKKIPIDIGNQLYSHCRDLKEDGLVYDFYNKKIGYSGTGF